MSVIRGFAPEPELRNFQSILIMEVMYSMRSILLYIYTYVYII